MLRLPGVAADGRVLHTGTPDGSGSGLDLLRQFALAKQQQARVEFGASRCRCNRTPHVGRQSSTPAIVGCRAALRSPWERQAVQLTVRSIGPLPRPRSAPHPSNVCPPPWQPGTSRADKLDIDLGRLCFTGTRCLADRIVVYFRLCCCPQE